MRPSALWPSSPQVRKKRFDSSYWFIHLKVVFIPSPCVFSFYHFPLFQRSRGSLCTPSWQRGSSPCWITSCSTWWVLRWVPLKSRTSVSLTSSPSSLFLTSAPSTWTWGMLWTLLFLVLSHSLIGAISSGEEILWHIAQYHHHRCFQFKKQTNKKVCFCLWQWWGEFLCYGPKGWTVVLSYTLLPNS